MADITIPKEKVYPVGYLTWHFEVWFQLETKTFPPAGFTEGSPVGIMEVDKFGMVKVMSYILNLKPIWVPKKYIDFDFDLLTRKQK